MTPTNKHDNSFDFPSHPDEFVGAEHSEEQHVAEDFFEERPMVGSLQD